MIWASEKTPSSVDKGIEVVMRPRRFAARADELKVSEESVAPDPSLPDPGRLRDTLGHRRERVRETVNYGEEPMPLGPGPQK